MAGSLDNSFAGYRFHRVLGSRSDVGVYEATELASDRPVVIETLVGDGAADEDLRDWFRWAWEQVRHLRQPGVVAVFDVAERAGVPFAVRESIGEDLPFVLESAGVLQPDVADAIFDQLAEALTALHEAGVVHGSLDTDCVLIGGGPEEAEVAYLTGFGRVEGHRRDDLRGLVRIHAAMLGPREAAAPPLAEVVERAEAGDYRTAAELAAAVAGARAGHAPDGDALGDGGGAGARATSQRRARRGFILATLVSVATVVAVVLITSGTASDRDAGSARTPAAGGPEADPPPAPSVSATGEGDPAPTDASASSIDVPGAPAGVAVRNGIVYVVTSESGELIGFDEASAEEVVGPVDLGAGAGEVTIVDGLAWITLPRTNQLAKVDLAAGKDPSAELIDVGERPAAVIGAVGSIFVADSRSGGLSRVDPGADTVQPVIIGAQEPRGIGYGADSLWVSDAAGSVLEVDPDDPAGSRSYEAGAEPRGVLVVDDAVWVANSGDGTVTRLDSRSGESESIDVGGEPLDLAADDERVWVSNSGGYVSSIEIATAAVERIEVPGDLGAPVGVAVGSEVWVTTEGDALIPLTGSG